MPRKGKQKGKKKGRGFKRGKGRKSFGLRPNASATRYTGPIHQRHRDDTVTVNLVEGYSQTVTAVSGAWSNNSVFPSNHVTAIGDFSSYSGIYQEFRVVGMSVTWVPAVGNSTPANSSMNQATPMFLCPSEQEQTNLTGDVAAYQHEGKIMGTLTRTLKCSIKAKEVNSMTWNLITAGVTNALCIKTWISGTATTGSAVIQLGHFYVEYAVQFRYRVLTDTSVDKQSAIRINNEVKQPRMSNQIDQKAVAQVEEKKGSAGSSPVFVVEQNDDYDAFLAWKKKQKALKPPMTLLDHLVTSPSFTAVKNLGSGLVTDSKE
jgi:hypothetical protein